MNLMHFFKILFALNLVSLLFLVFLQLNAQADQKRFLAVANSPKSFLDPDLAFSILNSLDIVEANLPHKSKQLPLLGMKMDDEYCLHHRRYFVDNPTEIFTERNYLTGYERGFKPLRYGILSVGGKNVLAFSNHFMSPLRRTKPIYKMPLNVQLFYYYPFYFRDIGRQFSCLTQMYNNIPGHQTIYKKDSASLAINEYKKEMRSKQCKDINHDLYFPKTISLRNEEECKQFFEHFSSPEYQELKRERNVVYFRKVSGVHKGQGVFPIDSREEIYLKEAYKNGTLCGKVKTNNLIQTSVYNPLLINGKKADFRVYLLIASSNPLIAYYNDGYITISLADFDPEKGGRETFLTNSAVAKSYLSKMRRQGLYQNMTGRGFWEQTMWSFENFQDYLLAAGLISNNNWLDEYFRPEIQKLMIHLLRAAQDDFGKHSSVFQVMRLDLIMDTDFKIWFMEANAQPGFSGFYGDLDLMLKNFFLDSFDVQFGLLKSRTKRIMNYVNDLIGSGEHKKLETEEGLLKAQEEFREITKNYFEPEFAPKIRGKFVKIIDENLSGAERYAHILAPGCLNDE